MKIDRQNIAQITNVEEMIEFLARNRYEEINDLESDEFQQLPEWVKDFVFILDFETEYEMQGLYTYLVNSTGHYLPNVILSFERSENSEIANLLTELQDTLTSVGLSPDILRSSEKDLSIDDFPEIFEKLDDIDNNLTIFIEEKKFWDNITIYMQREMNKRSA